MSLVIETDKLIDLLETLQATVSDEQGTDGILLYTQQGSFGEEPGVVTLLAGLSTNGSVSSHYYVPADGGTLDTTFWPAFAVGLVASAFSNRAAESEGDHVLRIAQLPDNQVEITEYDNPADGVKVTFNVHPVEEYPIAGVVRLIQGVSLANQQFAKDELEVLDGDTELWDMNGLGLLLRLSKRWKTRLVVHKSRTGVVHRVQMEGLDNWLGAVVPPVPDEAATLNSGISVEAHLDVPGLAAIQAATDQLNAKRIAEEKAAQQREAEEGLQTAEA